LNSRWVPFLSEEGFKYLQIEQVFAAEGIFWVNMNKDVVPPGEQMITCHEKNWADLYGFLTLPAFLPRRPQGAVWVPYPTEKHVPPTVRKYLDVWSNERE
jgi:hypothetical protein